MGFHEIVKRRKKDLAKGTLVSDDLLTALELEDLFTDGESQRIRKLNGHESMAKELYKIIGTAWTNDNIKRFIVMLRQYSNPIAANILEEKEQENEDKIPWKFQSPVPHFVGRQKELKELDDFLDDKKSILVIKGFGGQGKSQLCRYWIQERWKNEGFPKVVTLAGDSGIIFLASLFDYFKSIEPEIDPNGDLLLIFPTVAPKLPNEPLLWILDNVDELSPEVYFFCTSIATSRTMDKIVITSRINIIFPQQGQQLSLDKFVDEDAFLFVRNCLGNLSQDDVETLCTTMDNHPLALYLATGLINEAKGRSLEGDGYTVQDFIKAYEENRKIVLEGSDELKTYKKTIFSIVKTSLDFLPKTNEELIKNASIVLSLCRHDGVDFPLLCKILEGLSANTEELEVKTCLEKLKSVSLLASRAELPEKVVRIFIHPLVQECIRILHKDWKILVQKMFDTAEIVLENASSNILPNYLKIWENICQDVSLIQERFKYMEKIYCRIKNDHAMHSTFFQFTERETENRQILNEVEEAGGEKILPNLQLKQLQAELEKAIEEASKSNNVQMLLDLEEDLARILFLLEDFDTTEEMYYIQLSKFESNDDEPRSMRVRQNLAIFYRKRSNFENVEPLFHDVLTWREINLKPEDPDLLKTRVEIGIFYLRTNDFVKAEEQFNTVLRFQKRDKIAAANTKGLLALAHIKMGDFVKAKEMLVEVNKDLKDNHPNTPINTRNLAYCLNRLGEREEAERLLGLTPLIEKQVRKDELERVTSITACLKATLKVFKDAKKPPSNC